MKSLVLVFAVFAAAVSAEECVRYDEEITLRGTLSKLTFPEQPTYESIENGDTAATYYFVKPPKPFCVSEAPDPNGLKPEESAVDQVQLVFTGDARESYEMLRPHLGAEVNCSGSLFHQITGHHHTLVLLREAKCSPVRKAL